MALRRLVFKLLLVAAILPSVTHAEIAIVLNSKDDDMSLIDTTTYKVIKRVPLGKEPHHLIPTPDDRYVVVGNAAGNDLVMLDPSSGDIVKRLPRIADPYHLGFSPDQKWFVITANRLDRVDIYRYDNGNFTLAGKVPLPKTTSHMAFSRDSKIAYVTAQDSNQVAAIELATQKIIWKTSTGKEPAGVWLTPDGQHLLVGMTGEDYIEIFSPMSGKSIKRLKTGKGAHQFLPQGDGRHAFLTNRVENTISIIDMQKLDVVESFRVPGGPDCMELRKDGTELWVTSRWINRVSVVDLSTKKITQSIHVGRSPHGLYFPTHAARQ